MMSKARNSQRGFVLVLALWALGFLTVLALAIGFGTRQKILLLGRLEDRSQTQFTAEAGVKKAVAVLIDDLEKNQFLYSPAAKVRRHNNVPDFGVIDLGGRPGEVVCPYFDEVANRVVDRPGLCDEQGKININTTDTATLTRLIGNVLGIPSDNAGRLAVALIDWREYGRREVEGFFSDDYYKNLEYPYEMKDQPFERIDELLLVKGISKDVYEKLRPFVTIYGDGRININTASKEVLLALGLDVPVADKLLKTRRGQDGQDATLDDHIFLKTFDIASEVNAFIALEAKEASQLDAMNGAGILCTESTVYSFISRVPASGGGYARSIEVVFNAAKNKYEYWYEK
ncbi:MAG: general secretion pathway protein GspK [Candidatus Omnitrophica bacterium]|nr:general secretion pathway protein GspK [Candidatus Omnitrophota bacterium]